MWESYLSKHPNCQLVELFLKGLIKGFHIGFDYASAITLKSAKSNMKSVCFHGEVVDEYLQMEISLGHVAGPFPPDAIRWSCQQVWSHPQEPLAKQVAVNY